MGQANQRPRSPSRLDRWLEQWAPGPSRTTLLAFHRELSATCPLALVYCVVGSGFCGFVGRKGLHMPDYLLAVLMASNFMGLLLAGPLIGLLQRIAKARALARTLQAVSLLLLTVALTPSPQGRTFGPYLFVVQVFLIQTGVALTTTLRSAIWRANYAARFRGKLVVLIQLAMMVGGSAMVLLFTTAMDQWNLPFQAVYASTGLMGFLAAALFWRLPVRGERRQLHALRDRSLGRVPLLAGLAVLRRDRPFRLYMACQMLNGLATMVVEVVLVIIVADVLGSGWVAGGSALTVIPLAVTGLASLAWARWFDKTDIFRCRFWAATTWALSRLVLMAGVYNQSIPIILLSRAVSGIAGGGGQLAWRLGHMQFAPPEKDALYMGAHVSLTGLRGMAAPFIAIFLYHQPWLGPNGIGLIAVSAGCQFLAALGFLCLRRYAQPLEHPKNAPLTH